MTRLTDGKKTVEITMKYWTEDGYTEDISAEFFDGATEVKDVDYCVSAVEDWLKGKWDGDEDATAEEIENRYAEIHEITKYLTRWDDKSLDIRDIEEAKEYCRIDYEIDDEDIIGDPAEFRAEIEKYNREIDEADSLEEIAEIWNHFHDGSWMMVEEF